MATARVLAVVRSRRCLSEFSDAPTSLGEMVMMKAALVLGVALLSVSIPLSASQPKRNRKYGNPGSRTHHSWAADILNGKDHNRSTAQSGAQASSHSRATELDHLERQNSQVLHQSKPETRQGAGHYSLAGEKSRGQGSGINFAYHAPQSGQARRSASSAQRKR